MKPKVKVLVVDDDPIVLEVTCARLQKAGYEALAREDALGTSTTVAQENPDVVLLDVTMPGISGEALARLLSQSSAKRQPVAVIFHSNRDQSELDQLARECKALGSIQKTSSTSMFLLQFERLLRLRVQPAQAVAGRKQ
jgi:two-component system alkaline phosphatase synthesis response regulator PhoP